MKQFNSGKRLFLLIKFSFISTVIAILLVSLTTLGKKYFAESWLRIFLLFYTYKKNFFYRKVKKGEFMKSD